VQERNGEQPGLWLNIRTEQPTCCQS